MYVAMEECYLLVESCVGRNMCSPPKLLLIPTSREVTLGINYDQGSHSRFSVSASRGTAFSPGAQRHLYTSMYVLTRQQHV